MGKLFGTDGARGIANLELTCELAMNIGRAAAIVLTRHAHSKPKVLIGMDTRVSSRMLEGALIAGLCSVGADVLQVGVVPTPAVAYLVKEYKADAGIMISASHNPCEYNGIKLFNNQGFKLPDQLEDEIEELVICKSYGFPMPTGCNIGSVRYEENAVNKYIESIVSTVDTDLTGLKIALDCANGSASRTAEQLFSKLGAKCHMLHNKPDGININDKCGSTHMESLIEFVKQNDIDLGLAFDGDADRCLAVDENGEIVDGDKLIALFALDMKNRGQLKQDTAVVTVMSNIGFTKFADSHGIKVAVTKVGDRYVLEEMLKNDYSIGGEQSGHIIFKDLATTGDGQLTGVQLASIMARTKKPLSELASIMKTYPQTCVNIKTTPEGKALLDTDEVITEAIEKVKARLGNDGRILVRPSGTEPLIRIMLEGQDLSEIEQLANWVADVIKERINK
ncbi:MAG TPA: phosphoglucosamine mutase [Clostridiales bacterium]|nr:phosphoglucosamine mutase [Clostridiales bacterium]